MSCMPLDELQEDTLLRIRQAVPLASSCTKIQGDLSGQSAFGLQQFEYRSQLVPVDLERLEICTDGNCIRTSTAIVPAVYHGSQCAVHLPPSLVVGNLGRMEMDRKSVS